MHVLDFGGHLNAFPAAIASSGSGGGGGWPSAAGQPHAAAQPRGSTSAPRPGTPRVGALRTGSDAATAGVRRRGFGSAGRAGRSDSRGQSLGATRAQRSRCHESPHGLRAGGDTSGRSCGAFEGCSRAPSLPPAPQPLPLSSRTTTSRNTRVIRGTTAGLNLLLASSSGCASNFRPSGFSGERDFRGAKTSSLEKDYPKLPRAPPRSLPVRVEDL